MTNPTKLITKTEVRKALRKLIVEKPDMANPTRSNDDYSCAYHKGRGADIQRCIAGQVGYDFGLPTPRADDAGVVELTSSKVLRLGIDGSGLWANRFTDDARKFLSAAQRLADNNGDGPRKWGTITLAEIEKKVDEISLDFC